MPEINYTHLKALYRSVSFRQRDAALSTDSHHKQHRQSLEALHPMPVLPERHATRPPRALEYLERIEHVQVHKSSAKNAFYIDVYFRNADSNIPVHSPQCLGGDSDRPTESSTLQWLDRHEPSVQIEHTFADFVQMRKYFYWLSRTGHYVGLCSFCQSMISFHAYGKAKPRWNSTWFKTDDKQSELLSSYLRDLLEIVEKAPVGGLDQCEGQDRIPRVLARFLKPTNTD